MCHHAVAPPQCKTLRNVDALAGPAQCEHLCELSDSSRRTRLVPAADVAVTVSGSCLILVLIFIIVIRIASYLLPQNCRPRMRLNLCSYVRVQILYYYLCMVPQITLLQCPPLQHGADMSTLANSAFSKS